MGISCISDIHVSDSGDDAYKLLLRFLNHEKVAKSDSVALLGDVFDHLTGEHDQYLEKFSEFFQTVESLLASGKKVYFIEGNHDFHFKKTFKKRLSKNLNEDQMEAFYYLRGSLVLTLGEKKLLFCHGDQLDQANKAYMRWKKIYSSKIFGFFISHILTFNLVEKIGEKASSDSRERGKSRFNFEEEKEKYRKAAKSFVAQTNVDCLVGGHTHIKDAFLWDGKAYYNIGFPPKDQSFLFIDVNGVERISLA